MPIYKILSGEFVKKWELALNTFIFNLIENPTKEGLEMFIISLSDFIFVSIGYKVRYNCVDTENAKVSLQDVKKVSTSEVMSSNFRF